MSNEEYIFKKLTVSSPDIISLDRNEYFCSHPLEIENFFSNVGFKLNKYLAPDLFAAFQGKLSNYLNVSKEFITFGHGAEDLLIKILAWRRLYSSKLIVSQFSWANYDRIGQGLNYEILKTPYIIENNEVKIDLVSLKKQLSELDNSIVILTSPNNPTGYQLPLSSLESLISEFKQHLFILDVVYDLPTQSSISLPCKYSNAISLGSFSKFFGLPGARVGFCIGNLIPKTFQMSLGLSPYSVELCSLALNYSDYYLKNMNSMRNFAEILVNSSYLSCKFFKTSASFILGQLNLPENIDLVYLNECLQMAIIEAKVKPKMFNYNSSYWLRWGLGSEDINKKIQLFMHIFNENILKEH